MDSEEAPELEDESKLEVPFVAAGHQGFIEKLSELFKASYDLVNNFNDLVEQEQGIPQSRLEGFEQDTQGDEEAMLNMINSGRRVAARIVDAMLADRYNEVRGRSNLSREDEQQGRMLLSKGEEGHKEAHESMGWGNVAADARKAVHKLERVGQPERMG